MSYPYTHPYASSSQLTAILPSSSTSNQPRPILTTKKAKRKGEDDFKPSNGKGKAVVKTEEENYDDGEATGRKAKRPRLVLSCSQCKKRKVKCDRLAPACTNCIKRGAPDECHTESINSEMIPNTIARAADLQIQTTRIDQLESYINQLKSYLPNLPDYATFDGSQLPSPISRDISRTSPMMKQVPLIIPASLRMVINRSDSVTPMTVEETFSETEAAAVDLENGVALGGDKSNQTCIWEPTAGRTSIISNAALQYTSASTSIVYLNLDWNPTPNQIKSARRETLRKIYRALPDMAVINFLVDQFFESVSWLFHSIHAPSFRAELAMFVEMKTAGQEMEVDVVWVSLLAMVLCVTLDRTHSSRSTQSMKGTVLDGMNDDQLRAMPETLFQASQLGLALAEWEVYPQIRSIQVIILFTQYLQLCSSLHGFPTQRDIWLAGAIRIAQSLKLNRLGDSPETMPPDDRAFPPGKNVVRREMAKRIWSVLVYIDWMSETSRGRVQMISPSSFDTGPPSNLNDDALSPFTFEITPSPDSTLTDASADRIRLQLASQVRRTYEALKKGSDEWSYDTILELDSGYREILQNLPDRWAMVSETEETSMQRYQRFFLFEGLHNRIFRLHRPFSQRGYQQSKYSFSKDQCIKSAKHVIVATANIIEAVVGIYYCYSHVFGASIVLFHDLFQAIDNDLPDQASKEGVLRLAAGIFSRSDEIASPSLRAVVEQESRILAGLFSAAESRKLSSSVELLRALSESEKNLNLNPPCQIKLETFAQVLNRVGRSLNSNNSRQDRHAGTPPASRNFIIPTTEQIRISEEISPMDSSMNWLSGMGTEINETIGTTSSEELFRGFLDFGGTGGEYDIFNETSNLNTNDNSWMFNS